MLLIRDMLQSYLKMAKFVRFALLSDDEKISLEQKD
jgi:hypothetical protein